MARSFSQEARSDSHKIGETRYRMSHLPSTTVIARIVLLAGILLAVTLLASRSFFPAFAQEEEMIDYQENSTDSVAVYTATDPEEEEVSWSLDGLDEIDFKIDGGVLTFNTSPNFEEPTDRLDDTVTPNEPADDNEYVVTVVATDESGTPARETLRVKVINVDEPATIALTTAQPKASVPVTANLWDPDGRRGVTPVNIDLSGDTSTKWRWATSTEATGPWNDIEGATTNVYTPDKDDVNMLLRATATYIDGHGKDDPFTDDVNELEHTVSVISANPVLPLDYTNKAPKFPDQDPDTKGDQTAQERELKEDASAGFDLGDAVKADDPGADGNQETLIYQLEQPEDTVRDETYAFVIDSQTAQISVGDQAMLDFETTRRYEVVVRATDPGTMSATISVTIKILDVDEDPEIGDTVVGDSENLTVKQVNEVTAATAAGYNKLVSTYDATDQEDETADLEWSLSGSDGSRFGLYRDDTCSTAASTDVESVSLCFKEPPDYENSADNGRDHVYDVKVTVRDSGRNTDSTDVSVEVEDAQEGSLLSILNRQPQVGTRLEARLDDADGVDGSITWAWATSTSRTSGWTSIDTADAKDNGNYTPRASDVDPSRVYLQVTASYTDGFGLAQELEAVSDNEVKPRDSSNASPAFQERNPQYTVQITGNQVVGSGGAIPGIAADATNPFPITLTATDDEDDIGGTATLDLLTYTLVEERNSDWNHFQLDDNTSATFSFVSGTILDADEKPTYRFKVKATDPSGVSGDVTVTIRIVDGNEAPVFTEGAATVTYAENDDSQVETFRAEDPEESRITWTLDGTHAVAFSTSNQGVLTFKSSPNYEAATIPDGSGSTIQVFEVNVDGESVRQFSVTVQAGDGASSETRPVTVNVTNEEEPGTVAFNRIPKEDVAVTATLSDPDGSLNAVSWQWATSTEATGPWYPISAADGGTPADSGSTSAYTPRDSDVGYFLRATASYTDGKANREDDPDTLMVNESQDVARERTANKVLTADYNNEAPKFPDQDPDQADVQNATTTRKVKEDASPGNAVGEVVAATDKGADGQEETLFYRLYDDGDAGIISLPTGINANDIENEDEFFFIDSATGQIKVDSDEKLNFESAEEYTVAITATDPGGMISQPIVVTINVLNVNETPKLGDPDKVAKSNLESAKHKEGTATTTEVSTYTATDDENGDTGNNGEVLKWSLSGADMGHFSICAEATNPCEDPETYKDGNGDPVPVYLRFKKSPNFEAPADTGGNNVYNVTVVATDNDDNVATRDVAITVTNEDDLGKVTLSNREPEVGAALRAELTDPDGGVTNLTWEWKFSDAPDGTFQDIAGATSATYVPTTGDAARATYLRADAMYTDAQGEEKIATSSASELQVSAEDMDNQPPTFPDQDPNTEGYQTGQTRYVVEEREGAAAVDNKDGETALTAADPVTANDPEDNGTDTLTYTLGGPDVSLFTISNTTGQVSLRTKTKLDYETRTTYTVQVTATDPSLESDTMTLTIKVVKVDEAPTISKKGLAVSGVGSISYFENDTGDVASYTATGADAVGATWSLEGADARAFTISSGILSFRSSPNYESPADQGSDNVYNLTVKASSGSIVATRSVVVTVSNEDEDGSASISPSGQPTVGEALTASVTDLDGSVTGITWQWASSSNGSAGWGDISGARSATYTPVEADVGDFLRATASYTDGHGSGKSENAVTSSAVAAVVTEVPQDGSVSLSPPQLVVGDTVSASLSDPNSQ